MDELSKPVEDCENANLEEFLNTCNEMITHSLDKMHHLESSKRKLGPGEYGVVKNYMYKDALSGIEKDSGGKYL